MFREPGYRLDTEEEIRSRILPLCRLEPGEIWEDPVRGHRVGVLDAGSAAAMSALMNGNKARLAVNDPPYNLTALPVRSPALFTIRTDQYSEFSRAWIGAQIPHLEADAHLYIWIGADQSAGFQPLPEVMLLMREFSDLSSRSFITMRNQRGYGTSRNWMCIRQELLYYVKGKPEFTVQYTDIPKILKGYYKEVGGKRTENLERGRSGTIRPGNVWVDIQQVFYRLEENVPGAYAQKPLKAIRRIIDSGTRPGEIVLDAFAHAGTTLIGCELSDRRCYTSDIDPIFAELTIRRLEHLRTSGKTGWQNRNPFPELEQASVSR